MVEFDDQLKQRLVAFQTQQGLTADGVANADTWQALVSGAHGQGSGQGTGLRTTAALATGGGQGSGGCDCDVDDQVAAGRTDFSDDPESPDLSGVYEDNGDGVGGGGPDGADMVRAGRGGGHSSSGVPSQCRATAKACFSISRHTAWLLQPGRQVVVAVQALGGRTGHPTPTGQFSVQFHDRNHYSNKYHAPMPFYVNFAPQVGFHAGSLSVKSHGCVHLSRSSAERFFNYLQDGDPVDVVP
jgi:hypothetical protein